MAEREFPDAVAECAAGRSSPEVARRIARSLDVRRVILVEGVSDRAALEALAVRQERDLGAEGTSIVPMGGAMSVGRFLRVLGPAGLGLSLVGLCDVGEERYFRRSWEAAGLGADPTPADDPTPAAEKEPGFFVCSADLEDELIRALGTDVVEEVIAVHGELAAFRTFQNQPFQRRQTLDRQLHRFVGTLSGRKERYAGALAARLDLDAVPQPLERALRLGADTGHA